MDSKLQDQLEDVADESIEAFLVDMALIEADEGPVSTEYLLGMLEMTLVNELVSDFSEEEIGEMGMRETVECVRPNCDEVFDLVRTGGSCPECQTPHPDDPSDTKTIDADADDGGDEIEPEELLGEIRKIVRRREDDIRTALKRDGEGNLGDGDTQNFDP